jgi:hypothetical protein
MRSCACLSWSLLSLWYQNKATAKTTEVNVAVSVMSQS